MAEIYKFFNSGVNDPRYYQASDFADFFGTVLSSGLIHTDGNPALSVSVEAGTLNTIVSKGKAIMGGYPYENTTPKTLEHNIPEATLDRIDRIVLRLDLRNSERNILLHVKEGAPAATPVAPDLQRDNFVYEISLAQVRVRKNTVQLLPADLVDERLDEELCGLSSSMISIPTEQFQQQWDEFMSGIQDDGFASAADFATHKADTTAHGIGDKTTLLTTNKASIVGAMNELFTNANSLKTDWAGVVGSPLVASDTSAQLKSKTQTIKNTLAANLSAKGQPSAGTEPLTALVNKVANVNTGKKKYTNVYYAPSSNSEYVTIPLGFEYGFVSCYTPDEGWSQLAWDSIKGSYRTQSGGSYNGDLRVEDSTTVRILMYTLGKSYHITAYEK